MERLEPVEPAEPLEPMEPREPVEPETGADIDPRYARLGPAGLMRLRARYTEVIARLDEKALEPSVKEELRAKAEARGEDVGFLFAFVDGETLIDGGPFVMLGKVPSAHKIIAAVSDRLGIQESS